MFDEQEEETNDEEESSGEEEAPARTGESEDDLYHISSLSFELLDSLVESVKLSLLSGKYRFPVTSVEVRIVGGSYTLGKVSKAIVSQTASQLMQEAIRAGSSLVEPMVEVELIGEEEKVEAICGAITKKRGRIEDRQERRVKAVVPAEAIRGWVKDIRAMGFDVEIKFSSYETVQGVDAQTLVDNN